MNLSRGIVYGLSSLLVTIAVGCGGGNTSTSNSPTTTASVSTTSLTFSSTTVSDTSPVQTVNLTDTGSAPLTGISVVVQGTDATAFPETTTCATTLQPNATCTISVSFMPTAVGTATAMLNIVDNATNSPQTVALTGTGAASGSSPTLAYTLYTFPESDNSVTPLYALVNSAKTSIDMTMYALEDTTFTNDLVNACKRGVIVRVILDINDEQSGNTPAYNALNAQTGCSAVWANTAFEATHEKAFVIDGTTIAVMSLNLQTQYYSTTRDFAEVYNDPTDIAAFEGTFNADYAAGTPISGVQGVSDFSFIPSTGTDLIWSPTTAQAAMEGIINNAQSTLVIENEELLSSVTSTIVADLVNACKRGVKVELAMVDESDDEANFTTLTQAGCGVHTVPDTSNGFYIHAKAVVADYGLPTQKVYMGSINYSNASMNNNRELGMYITDPTSVTSLETTMSGDYASATPWQ